MFSQIKLINQACFIAGYITILYLIKSAISG